MSRYIDADKIRVIFMPTRKTNYSKGWNDALKAVVENAETEDVAPVIHAHWVNYMRKDFLYDHGPDYELVEDGYTCSNCNHYESMFKKHYCANCGAKMDEVVK